MRYPVTLSKDDNGTFLVSFPDVPDAVTFGETKDEALGHARDALLTVFDAYMRDRRDIPAPSARAGVFVELPALETSKVELYRAMRSRKVGKAELARRLDWHLPQVDRVLNVRHGSQIDQLEAALSVLGKKLVVTVEDSGTHVDDVVWRHFVPRRSGPLAVHGAIMAATQRRSMDRPAAASATRSIKRAAKKR